MSSTASKHPQLETFLLDTLRRVRAGEVLTFVGVVAALEPMDVTLSHSGVDPKPRYDLKVLCSPEWNSELAQRLTEADIRRATETALTGVARTADVVLRCMQDECKSRAATRKTIIDA